VALFLQQLTHGFSPQIIILTGRDEEQRDLLSQRLTDRKARHDELHMRRHGDTRRDDVVKLELFNDHVRHRFNVIAVFEDRDRLVRLWRRLGLLTYAVAPKAG
jgi:hypothetical protein